MGEWVFESNGWVGLLDPQATSHQNQAEEWATIRQRCDNAQTQLLKKVFLKVGGILFTFLTCFLLKTTLFYER